MKILLQKLLASSLFTSAGRDRLLTERIVHALGSSNERITYTALRTLVETRCGRLWIVPNLLERVRFNLEQSLLVICKLSLLLKEANGKQEVPIVHCALLTAINSEEVIPDVASQAPLVVA